VQRGTREVGDPGPGQVLVDFKAVSLNFRDLILVRGRPGMPPLSNVIACSDGAGVVRAVGPGVRAFQPGDRVCGTFFENWSSGTLTPEAWAATRGGGIDGMLAERVLLNEAGAVRAPSHLSFEQAACLPCAAVTAWHALIERANVRPGRRSCCSAPARHLDILRADRQSRRRACHHHVEARRELERARRLGAHVGVNYRTHPQWSGVLGTDGRGVDVTLEVGGPETFVQSLAATRMAGTIAVIGALETGQGTIHPSQIYAKSLRLHGIYVGSREMFTSLNAFLELHRLEPSIDRVFGFDDASAAYQYLASAAHFGKVVIRVG
jgi:NADPH:quinone reductase-like Zn-dependent oxidoreductase